MPVDANIAASLLLVVLVATKLVINSMKTNKTDKEIILLLFKN